MRRRLRATALVLALLLIVAAGLFIKRRYVGSVPIRPGMAVDTPSAVSTWPWPDPERNEPYRGVTHWTTQSDDGTGLDLLRFDFAANPNLRLELYDQDEDDQQPFDNEVEFFSRGVGQAIRHLNRIGRGRVVAAWNGLFFSAQKTADGRHLAHHVAPVVLNGRVRHHVGNHRWTFGVQYEDGKPRFRTYHLPDRETLERQFSFAAGGAQCLIREGAALRLQPFPKRGDNALPRPVPSTPAEAGHIPDVDHMRTSRTSMGWSRDSRQLHLLIVREPDFEGGSIFALRRRLPVSGGWTLHDLQRFWVSMDVWGAVNVDGGDCTQMAYLCPDGAYEMVPPRWATPEMRLTFSPEFREAPTGGSLMYFFIRDTSG